MSGKLAVEVDTLDPDANQIQLNNPQWNCQVKDAPYDLTTAGLLGSFDFQPKVPVVDASDHGPVRVSVENRFFAPLSTLPKAVMGAFIASEDANFYNHQGIETQAILGAFRKNVAIGRIAVGGSTITMQTAKNLFLSHDRTLSRKIQEIFLAWHMEKTIPKDRILEIYLNIIEFGPRIYGLGHASQHFFSKEPQNINLIEASFLANLLPNPKQRYLSFCQGKLTSGMTSLMVGLLKRMISLGKISTEDYQEALATGLKFNSSARASDAICLEKTALKVDQEKVSPL
jgi:membrane peptidoglycan carboxypeptidase